MQSSFGTINPATTDGPALANALTDTQKAHLSSHSGTARPIYAVAGTIWIDNSVSPWHLNMFNGAQDTLLGTVNPTTGVFYAAIDSAAYASSSALAAVVASLSNYALISSLGTAAAKNTGTAVGQIPLLETGGKLPAVDGSQLTHVQGFRAPDFWARDEKASGTAGGGSTAATYVTRALTTVKRNILGSAASLDNNQITLPAGNYYIRYSAPVAGAVGVHHAAIYDVNSATYLGYGANSTCAASNSSNSFGERYIESSTPILLELRHRTAATVATSGFGIATSFGDVEVYGDVQIWKVD